MKADGIVFAVRRVEADYIVPAVFEDDLIVETTPISMMPARLVLGQLVLRQEVFCSVQKSHWSPWGTGANPDACPTRFGMSLPIW